MSLITIRNLSKRFLASGNKVVALSHVSLDVDQGDIFGIIGQSGAGKSTLMRCLAALEKPETGEIVIENQDIVTMNPKDLRLFRKKMGMIFQHFNLLSSRSVRGNISYPLEVHQMPKAEREKRIDEVLGYVGLESKRDAYPAHLSGGQKQRVGIARALACHPSVLLCDEATSALDPKTTRDILNLLKQLNKNLGLTIILISHEIDVIKQICNKVAVLDQGKLVETGSVAQVFSDPQNATTRQLLQNTVHEIPPYFFKDLSPDHKLLRLTFKGEKAGEPIMTKMIVQFGVEVNILLGWIDSLQGMIIGNLVIELKATGEKLESALAFLRANNVHIEELKDGGG